MKPHNRKLIKNEEPPTTTTQSPFFAYSPLPLLQTMNATTVQNSFKPHSPFDSSMALTILVLLTALFFMGFFSIYIRRFADDSYVQNIYRRRRHHHHHHHRGPPPPSTSSVASSRFSSSKGLDPSTVQSLPVFPYGGDAKHPIDCPVCLGELEENDTVKMIPYCKHVFHQVCIDKWLSSHVSCPLCRTTRLFPVEERCLGVVKRDVDQGVSELIERSTEDGGDTCGLGMRRTSSGSSLGEQGCLQRQLSSI